MAERYIRPDAEGDYPPPVQTSPPFTARIPWNWVGPLLVTLFISGVSYTNNLTTKNDMSKFTADFEKTYYSQLDTRVKALELAKESTGREISALTGKLNVLEVKVTSVESGQARAESLLREATGELKMMIRDLASRFERGSGRAVPQHHDRFAPDLYPSLPVDARVRPVWNPPGLFEMLKEWTP